MSSINAKLPDEFTHQVGHLLDLLGKTIKQEYGEEIYNDVEEIRSFYKDLRGRGDDALFEGHKNIQKKIAKKNTIEKFQIAHSFTLSLEIINSCENAYRTFRLKNHSPESENNTYEPIIFVLTAHPTEARSAASIILLHKVHETILESFENPNKESFDDRLLHLMSLLIKIPISKSQKPSVKDEADYIFSVLLKKQNIEVLGAFHKSKRPVYIRTWVGGDKDGHPGVNALAMMQSLGLSRTYLVELACDFLFSLKKEIKLLGENGSKYHSLQVQLVKVESELKNIRKLKEEDAKNLNLFNKALGKLKEDYLKSFNKLSPDLQNLSDLVEIFPGLVVPLELREDAKEIRKANKNSTAAISKMIQQLKKLSKGGKVQWYARGLVISMCEKEEDFEEAVSLLSKNLGGLYMPIIPLYETKYALENASQITKATLNKKRIHTAIKEYWGEKFEVMLGYSDSAKESGAFFSRVQIYKTLNELEKVIESFSFRPIFFHGSGGSVARGGGSLEEQISWWPISAKIRFKATIQGEMIYRSFASPEILKRQIAKIRTSIDKTKNASKKDVDHKSLYEFANKVREKYASKVSEPKFLEMVEKVSPYPYLDQLKIGSRPSKRKKSMDLSNLRAIPWVLCWTQTRVLFPVWWGIGSSWQEEGRDAQTELIKVYQTSDLFRSFVKNLAYTLAKVDLSVWKIFLYSSDLEDKEKEEIYKEFQKEYSLSLSFVKEITDQKELLWFRSWLATSIELRSTMIYPLNLLEIDALKNKDMALLRETVTGVASGMLTTG